jgi:hypothetical protein
MKIAKKTLNWLPRQNLWQEAQTRRAVLQKNAAADRAQWQNLAAGIAATRDNLVTGQAELAAKMAAKRLNIKV